MNEASTPPPRLRAAAVLAVALLATASAARAEDAPAAPPVTGALLTPTPGAGPPDVLRGFAGPERPWSRGHRGVDLAASSGLVTAPAAGTVRFVGSVAGRGVLTLAHPDGTLSSFEPVTSDLTAGQAVAAGQEVARVQEGAAHCPVRCVHWGVRREDAWAVGAARFDRYLDPLLLLGWSGPSVLWPVGDAG